MIWVFFGLMCVAAFAGQFYLCRNSQKVINKLWPVIILTAIEIICLIVVFAAGTGSDSAIAISMTALTQMVICGVLLVPAELAWLVYGIMWYIEKRKNKTQVYGENT